MSAQLAAEGKPHLSGNQTKLSIVFGDPRSYSGMQVKDVAAMQAWLHQDEMVKALHREIDALPADGRQALSTVQREQRLDELKAELDRLERQEEALVHASQRARHRRSAACGRECNGRPRCTVQGTDRARAARAMKEFPNQRMPMTRHPRLGDGARRVFTV